MSCSGSCQKLENGGSKTPAHMPILGVSCQSVCEFARLKARLAIGIRHIVPFLLACVEEIQEIWPTRYIGPYVQYIVLSWHRYQLSVLQDWHVTNLWPSFRSLVLGADLRREPLHLDPKPASIKRGRCPDSISTVFSTVISTRQTHLTRLQ